MTTIRETKLINLNSDNANKLNGNFLSAVQFSFVGLLTDDSSIRNVYVSVQNAQFPYSFYNINVYNNLLKLSVDANPAVTLTLTRGNYNATTLITEIQTQLTSAGITSITLSISSITGLLTFTKTSGSFILYSSGSTCFKVLGFDPSTNYSSVASVIIAPYPLNLLGTLKLRIASYELSINSIDSSVSGNLNILASIPINAGNFGLIMYDNTSNIVSQLNTRTLDGFDLEIIDDDGNLINFNNTYWTISLLLIIERDAPLPESKLTFNEVTKESTQKLAEKHTAGQALGLNEQVLDEQSPGRAVWDVNVEIYPEEPNLEETIIPEDLDLLLYSHGIR